MFPLYLFSLKRILPEFALDDLAFVECVFLWRLGVLDLFGGLTLLLFFAKSRSCCMSYFFYYFRIL